MGNQRLWKALEEREHLYAQTDMTDDDGMRLAELEGIVGEEDGYTAESDAAVLLDGLDIPEALHDRRCRSCRAARRSACCWRRRCSAARRRCCSTSRPTTSTSTRSTGCAISWSATTAR